MKIEVNTLKFVAALKSAKEILKENQKDKFTDSDHKLSFISINPYKDNAGIEIVAISGHMASREKLGAIFLDENREPMRLDLVAIEKILTELKGIKNPEKWIDMEDFIQGKDYFISIQNSNVFKVHEGYKPYDSIDYEKLWDTFTISANPRHFFPLSTKILTAALNVLKTSDYSGQDKKDTLYNTFFLCRDNEKTENGEDNTEALLYETCKKFRNLEVIQMMARPDFENFYN